MIPLNQISRIEILKGPFSSLYGPGAIGGVINVFTDKDTNSITSSSIDSSYGSNGTKQSSFNTYYKNDDSYLDFTFTDFITDGIDATHKTTGGDDDLDPSDRQTFGLNMGGDIGENTSVSLNMIDSKANIMYDETYGNENYQNDLRQIGFGVNQKFSDRFQTRIDINNQNIMRHGSKYELNTSSIVNELDFDFSKLSLGVMNSNDKDTGNKKSIKHKDIFTQWQGLITDHELSLGARVIDHNDFGTHTTYNFNWARDISINSRLSASYGSATNIPNHYQNKQNVKNSQTTLDSERSKSLEIGLQNQSNIGLINFKVYQTKIEDTFSYIDPESNYDGYYINDGTTDISGVELSLETSMLGWDLDTTIDYNKSIDKATKKQKGRRPNRSISFGLSKSSGKWNRSINWTGKSHAWDKNSETTKLGGYGLLNLRTSYDFTDDLTVYLNRNNALDKDYEVARGYKTHGKTSTLGLTYNF